jgi:hypothetical protein
MPQPYNYNLNLPNPAESLINTLNVGKGITQLRSQRAEATQAEQAAAAQQKLQEDLNKLGENPSPAALTQIMVRHPQLSEHFKRTYDVLSSEHQQARVDQASRVYAALAAGQPEMAQNVLKEQATAYRNSGMEREAKTLEDLAEMARVSPEAAKTSTGLFLAAAMGPDKFTETFTKLQSERREAQLAPEQLTEAQAKARKAATEADFAGSNAALDLQKKGWDIFKIQEDTKIAKENSRIAAMKAATDRETNELKREELNLKLEEARRKRDQEVRDRAAEIETANGNIDNMMNTMDRIIATPIGVVEDATGPIESRLPTMSSDVADFEALIENLDAQAFISQIPNIKGMGALSDAEGKKLTAALQSFSLKQSPRRLIANVKEAQRLMLKARTNLANKFGVPETIPNTPAAAETTLPEDIDAILNKYLPGGQ